MIFTASVRNILDTPSYWAEMAHEAKDGKQITKQKNGVKMWSGEQWRTQEFCSWGEFQQIQLRTEGRENGDLGGGSP
jgi:hypothetical protein